MERSRSQARASGSPSGSTDVLVKWNVLADEREPIVKLATGTAAGALTGVTRAPVLSAVVARDEWHGWRVAGVGDVRPYWVTRLCAAADALVR
jgi:hypothetical protein